MSNKQVIAIFILGIALLLGAFWAGLNIVKQDSSPPAPANRNAQQAAPAQANRAAAAEPSPSPQPAEGARFVVRVAAFGTVEQANQLAGELRRKYISAHTQMPSGQETLFRVNIGPYNRREDAQQVANELAAEGRKGIMIIAANHDN